MPKENRILLVVIIIIILAAGVLYWANSGKNQPGQINNDLKVFDTKDHILGDANAPVKIIVYSDFECPFCAKYAGTIKQVEEKFKDKVAISFRHYPLPGHPQAELAAQASECAAEQGKFWQMHDKLFADNLAGRLSPEQYKTDAAELGLDEAQFNQCLDSEKYKNRVAEDKAEGKRIGVTGTPTSFVNGAIYP